MKLFYRRAFLFAGAAQVYAFLPLAFQPPSSRSTTTTSLCSSQHIPEPRWACPAREDVCSQTGVTLSRFMMEMIRNNPESPELQDIESIMTSLQVACKTLSKLVRTSSLRGLTGLEDGGGSINVQGEEQKKLDVLANDVLKQALRWTGKLSTIASEEEDAPVDMTDILVDTTGDFVAVFDPLDGSSNVGTYRVWAYPLSPSCSIVTSF
jgi:fructose-1,6-bisphosphatase I